MSEVTRILSTLEQGDPNAAAQLLPLVYDELRQLAAQKLAKEKPGQTLQATALVHEVYLRLVGSEQEQHWDSRGHFFAAAAEAMRRILIDQARRKHSVKAGGAFQRLPLEEGANLLGQEEAPREDLLALHEALELADKTLEAKRFRSCKRLACKHLAHKRAACGYVLSASSYATRDSEMRLSPSSARPSVSRRISSRPTTTSALP